ncbi:MAG: HipA domain-containing protein [Thermomonas sp.]
MSSVEVWLDDASLGPATVIGGLTRDRSKTGDTVRFDYAAAWLSPRNPVPAFALDHDLPLAAGAHYSPFGADHLTGIFVDCSPDRWGKMLMERREVIQARAQERKARILRGWDFLLGVNDESRMGALRLRDPERDAYMDSHWLTAPPITDLRTLEHAAHKVERGANTVGDDADMAKWILQLIAPGASLGGARPKASFRDTDGSLWLAKFPSREDRRDVGMWEFLAYRLSLAAGIDMPPARMLALSDRGSTFAVRRFDRSGASRRLYASAMTRLARDHSEGASYLDLVEAIEADGTSAGIGAQLEQLFRRVLFNVVIGNRDDHLRNHGFLREGNGWVLSPAFDVNPNPDKHEHVLTLDGSDASPDSGLLMATRDFYRLTRARAEQIEQEIRGVIRGWKALARQLGIRNTEIQLMGGVIDPDR